MKQHNEEQCQGMTIAERRLCDAFLMLENREEVRALLNDLCTPAELEAMVDRWRVVLMLRDKLSYREIAQKTGVSVTTIGRVARFLMGGAGGYELALKRTEGTQ